MWIVVPFTVQFPLTEKPTVRPELAVAETAKSGSPNVLFASGANVIVWFAFEIENDRLTSGAAL